MSENQPPKGKKDAAKADKSRKSADGNLTVLNETAGSPHAETACRRSFVKTAFAATLGGVALGAPLCGGVRMALAPATQKGETSKFYPLAPLDSLTPSPQKFTIVDDRKDAWTTTPRQKIGSVYLRKAGDEVQAFHTVCPHAGCMILAGKIKNPKTGTEEELFYCPCHAAHFHLDGYRIDEVSPRDLDRLEIAIENGLVSVRYENFTSGIAEQKPMS